MEDTTKTNDSGTIEEETSGASEEMISKKEMEEKIQKINQLKKEQLEEREKEIADLKSRNAELEGKSSIQSVYGGND
jgi:hypothetical protein